MGKNYSKMDDPHTTILYWWNSDIQGPRFFSAHNGKWLQAINWQSTILETINRYCLKQKWNDITVARVLSFKYSSLCRWQTWLQYQTLSELCPHFVRACTDPLTVLRVTPLRLQWLPLCVYLSIHYPEPDNGRLISPFIFERLVMHEVIS